MKKYFDKYTIALWGAVVIAIIGYVAISRSATYWALNTYRGCMTIAFLIGAWGIYGLWKRNRGKK